MSSDERPGLSNLGFPVRSSLARADLVRPRGGSTAPVTVVGAVIGTILGVWLLFAAYERLSRTWIHPLAEPLRTPFMLWGEAVFLTVVFGIPSLVASAAILCRRRPLLALPTGFVLAFVLPPYALVTLHLADRAGGFAMLMLGAWVLLGWFPASAVRRLLDRRTLTLPRVPPDGP